MIKDNSLDTTSWCRCGDCVWRWVSQSYAVVAMKICEVKYVIILYAICYYYYILSFSIIVVETRTIEHW